ncbi:thermonuclease family protein [Sphingobium chungbukense]|uniref:TNase-like domain-containing protein n=1 Tax=Sphingobium chungbukense TaxID=56193 RepID=A0A0M3ALH2_9SPHN|nr:thermonuclease family protein [Sphingobium chungbukense]KKW89404.1 hypothetical protein YP76_25335 [Sphingobium chungbukense]
MANWWDQDETVNASAQPAGNWWDQDQTVEQPKAKARKERWWDRDATIEKRPSGPLAATGEAHDGDTFRLNTGQNGRLYGVDAFELDQQGMRGGKLVPLGQQSREALIPFLRPDATVTATGKTTYGRPVVSLQSGGNDAGQGMLDQGMGLATPQYLKGDPRLTDYMEAERLARLNRRGAFAGQFQDPATFRKGDPDPWAKPEEGEYGNSIAVFADEPTPFQGLRPEIAEGYQKIWTDPASTADDLLAYAKDNGFIIDADATRKAYVERAKRGADPTIRYQEPPRLLTDPGDGMVGAAVRGAADPINMLDEMGAVIDTIGLTPGRENVWSSDRRFGDILWNNIDQNRSILDYDDANHPYARFGGQLASGIILPGATAEGVGLAAARKVLQAGGSRFAAEKAAQTAVRMRLGMAGSVEGGLAGFGAGEGDALDRTPSAAVGALAGGALGYGSAALAQTLGPVGRSAIDRIKGRKAAETVLDEAPGVGVDEAISAASARAVDAPPPGFTIDMANEATEPLPSISSPRVLDRIDVNSRARPMLDPATDMERMAQAERVSPTDVLPLPSNVVASQEEAASIGAGLYPTIKAPNEAAALESRMLPRGDDPTRELPKRGPADLVTFLRTQGGVIDQGGELRAMGISDNAGRDLDFARGEQRFGKLVDNDNGMTLDQAADLAWRSGYFPDHAERPTIREFLGAVDNTNRGVNRSFHPDDLAEVDAFNAARDRRFAVERARDQGAPLAEDRGQPVSMDDLEANQPPLSAYEEWGDQAPDFAGNIRLSKLDSPQSIQRALSQADRMTGGFDAARRGRITQAETQSLANELGMTPDQLLSRRKGQAFNAEEALAARQILAKSGNELVNMARRIQRMDDPGEEALAAFRQAWVRHVAIQEQIAGATAEAGRTLAQFRMVADGRNVRGDVLAALSEGAGGRDRLKKAADIILDNADTPQRLNKIAAQALKPKWLDKINEYWVNSLLSGPQTHVVNMLSNTMTALAQIPEHGAAAMIGLGRRAVAPNASADRVMFSELGARSVGLLQGAREGLAQAVRTFRTGDASDFANKVEARSQDAISGRKGEIIRLPTRLLSAEDELFKAMARRMELAGLAVRQAGKERLTGEAARKRAGELLANPTEKMLDQAFDYGRYVTFQRPLGPAARGISQFTQWMPGAKFVLPFIRTPTNLLKFSLERSPAAPLVDSWRADFRAGGARRDLAVARAMVGTGVGALVTELAANGYVTGAGPADPGARALLRADGWQPYSIKIGDKYISYQRLDPFATTLGVAAGMVDLQDYMTDKQKDKGALLMTASIMQNLSSKTWLSGMGDLIEAVNDPMRYGEGFARRLAGSAAVPAGIAQVARTVDPTMREAEDILDAAKARIPGISTTLPERRDVWGAPVTGEGGVGPDIFSPVWVSTAKNDPVNKALLQARVNISEPLRDVKTSSGEVRRLTGKEYGEYRALAGSIAYGEIGELTASPDWMAMDQTERKKEVTKILRSARERARAALGL